MLTSLSLFMVLMSKSPFLASLSLVVSTLVSSVLLAKHVSSWLFIINTLLFTGGMMILFTYVTTISSSQKIHFKFDSASAFTMIVILGLPTLSSNPQNFPLIINPSFLYETSQFFSLMFLILYLLALLLISMSIISSNKGSLKSPLAND